MSFWIDLPQWQPLDPITAFKMNAILSNLGWLKTRPQDLHHGGAVSSLSLTSTSFVELDATILSRSVDTNGGNALFGFNIPYWSHSAASGVMMLDLKIDDSVYLSSLGASPKTYGMDYWLHTSAGDADGIPGVWVVPASIIPAGSHTFKLMGRTTSGTVTIALVSTDWAGQSWVMEI